MTVIDALKTFLARFGADKPQGQDRRGQLAAACLLVEAARLDGGIADAERRCILGLLEDRFGLAPDEADTLLASALQEGEESVQLFGFARSIVAGFDHDRRVALIEMLWEVAYADGYLHDYEANLVRRLAGLLFVPDQDAGAARKRALARMGLSEGLG